PYSAVRARSRLATLHLSALARDLLHLLDVLWLGGARIAHRLRLLDHLCRPHPVGRAVLAADHAHRAAGKGTEHHVDCRLHCRPLRQGPDRRCHRGADPDHRHHSHIALQLKAVSSSLTTILVHIGPASGAMQPVLGDIALYVAVAMAIFAVLFGTRHIDATEHQDGLMLAIATESIVKLVAFVGVGIFVTFWMFDGPRLLFAQAMERPDTAAVLTRDPAPDTLLAMTLLSLFAIVLLPRQFHVTVVENNSEDEIRRASWL